MKLKYKCFRKYIVIAFFVCGNNDLYVVGVRKHLMENATQYQNPRRKKNFFFAFLITCHLYLFLRMHLKVYKEKNNNPYRSIS